MRGGDRKMSGCAGDSGLFFYSENDQIGFSQLRNLKNRFRGFAVLHQIFRLAPGLRFRRNQLAQQFVRSFRYVVGRNKIPGFLLRESHAA